MTAAVSLDPCVKNATIGPNVLMGDCHNELAPSATAAALYTTNMTNLLT
jgi:hypothetical protein